MAGSHRPRSNQSAYQLAVGVLLAFGLGAAISLVHLPYAILKPGPTTDVLGTHSTADGQTAPRIQITGAPTFPTSGSLDFTTVRVDGGPGYPVNAIDLLAAWIDPDKDVYPEDALFPPDATREQIAEENRVEMTGAQQEAAAVALRALGHEVPVTVKVASVAEGAPAAGALSAGDVLISVGGTAVTDAASVRAAIRQVPAGESVPVVVDRDGALVPVEVPTGRADDGRTVLGIVLTTAYQLPFDVTFDIGNVGGPSAGLMFALGIYDKLTDGALTGGAHVAGTGTIDDAGAVGPIGGIRQKLIGAQDGGAAFFLAPGDNCDEVVGHEPPEMTVVRVDDFEQALQSLSAIGQGRTDALPHCGSTGVAS